MNDENNNLIDKFEKMISDDSSIFLDADEVEEIILYYFNDGDIMMAEKAIELGDNLYPNSININILRSEILILKGKTVQSYNLIENLLNIIANESYGDWSNVVIKLKAYAKEDFIEPGPNAQEKLQEAMILMETGDTLVIKSGVYVLEDSLSLDVDKVIVRGEGMDKTILDFHDQKSGAQGLLVTSDAVTLKDFEILNELIE